MWASTATSPIPTFAKWRAELLVAKAGLARTAVNPLLKDAQGQAIPMGLLEGNPGQVGNQLIGILISWAFAIVGSLILLRVTDLLVGLRVTEEEEVQGSTFPNMVK